MSVYTKVSESFHWKTLWKHSKMQIAIISREGYIRDVNRSFMEEYHYAFTEIKGRHLNDITNHTDRDKIFSDMKLLLAGRIEAVGGEVVFVTKTGETLTKFANVYPIRDVDHEVVHFVCETMNIPIKQEEMQLHNRELAELKRVVSKLEDQLTLDTKTSPHIETHVDTGNALMDWKYPVIAALVFLIFVLLVLVARGAIRKSAWRQDITDGTQLSSTQYTGSLVGDTLLTFETIHDYNLRSVERRRRWGTSIYNQARSYHSRKSTRPEYIIR